MTRRKEVEERGGEEKEERGEVRDGKRFTIDYEGDVPRR